MKMILLTPCLLISVAATTVWAQSGAPAEQPTSQQSVSEAQTDSSASSAQNNSAPQAINQTASASDSNSENGSNSSPEASSMTPWLPSAINGETGSLSFLTNGERSNWLSAGITVSSTYDDNALSNNLQKVGNVGYLVMPNISLHESRPRTDLMLTYSPGFTFNQRLAPQYTAAHDLNFNFQYRLTEHVTARFKDDLLYGANSFDGLNQTHFEQGGNVLHHQNTAIVIPLSNQLTNTSGAELIDQVGENTMIGAGGYFSRLHFLGTSATNNLLTDNQTWSGDGFFSTRISRRNSVGVTYSYQKLATYGSIGDHATTNSALIFYTLYVKPRVTLSFFAGPSYTTNELVSTRQSLWMADGGATLGWQGPRTSMQVSAIHNVSDGGGLTGAVRTYAVNAGIRRQFSRQWTGNIGVSYSSNDPLGTSGGNTFYAVDGTAGIERIIAQRVTIALMYGRDHQSFSNTAIVSNPLADHNRAWVSVSYHFLHPLGI